jgi:hypothetical protein
MYQKEPSVKIHIHAHLSLIFLLPVESYFSYDRNQKWIFCFLSAGPTLRDFTGRAAWTWCRITRLYSAVSVVNNSPSPPHNDIISDFDGMVNTTVGTQISTKEF